MDGWSQGDGGVFQLTEVSLSAEKLVPLDLIEAQCVLADFVALGVLAKSRGNYQRLSLCLVILPVGLAPLVHQEQLGSTKAVSDDQHVVVHLPIPPTTVFEEVAARGTNDE